MDVAKHKAGRRWRRGFGTVGVLESCSISEHRTESLASGGRTGRPATCWKQVWFWRRRAEAGLARAVDGECVAVPLEMLSRRRRPLRPLSPLSGEGRGPGAEDTVSRWAVRDQAQISSQRRPNKACRGCLTGLISLSTPRQGLSDDQGPGAPRGKPEAFLGLSGVPDARCLRARDMPLHT